MPQCGICGGEAQRQPTITEEGSCVFCKAKVVLKARGVELPWPPLPSPYKAPAVGFLNGPHPLIPSLSTRYVWMHIVAGARRT